MGLIFDSHSAKLYESWYYSPQGRAMDKRMEEFFLTLLVPRQGERILDIGCGEGNHLLFFGKLGLDINGIDASPHMINRARKRLGNRCTLKTGMAEDLPFDDNEFDLAVLTNTLEFLDDPLQALSEAGRVARRSVFIGTMNSLSWHYLCKKLQCLYQKTLFQHVRFYNLWELKSYVKTVFGHAPMAWQCGRLRIPFSGKVIGHMANKWNLQHYPFGSFLGVGITIEYKMKTDNLPLRIRINKARQSIADGITMGHRNYNKEE